MMSFNPDGEVTQSENSIHEPRPTSSFSWSCSVSPTQPATDRHSRSDIYAFTPRTTEIPARRHGRVWWKAKGPSA